MNTHTYGQWARYCEHHCDLDAVDQVILLWLVHYHDAATQVSWPSARVLANRSRFDRSTVMPHLSSLAERKHVVLAAPAVGRRAARYSIPWLSNPVQTAEKGARLRSGSRPQTRPLTRPVPLGTYVPKSADVDPDRSDDVVEDVPAAQIDVAAAVQRWRRDREATG